MTQIVHRQVVQSRRLSQIQLPIVNQLVSQSRLQVLIVPQHQTVVRRVTQTQVIQQVAQHRHLSQTLLPIVNQSVNRFRRQDQTQLRQAIRIVHQIVVQHRPLNQILLRIANQSANQSVNRFRRQDQIQHQ